MVDRIDPNATWDEVGDGDDDGEDYGAMWEQIAEMEDVSSETLSFAAAVRRTRNAA